MIKKLMSWLLVVTMMCSLCVPVLATEMPVDEPKNDGYSTEVTYNGEADNDGDGQPDAQEAYTVAVPAQLAPGNTGTVTLEGTWASNRTVTVTASESIDMVNSINENDIKELDVIFYGGIKLAGSNTSAVSQSKDIAVEKMTNALFGTWEGLITYNVNITDNTAVLEGDGQTFYSYAPSTLTFRSTAPIDEFQEVQINGVPVDPSAYTLSEGSTVVTLNIDYLSLLDIDTHDITIVSENQTSSGKFVITDSSWNSEVGFWYDKPYVMAGFGGGLGVMFNKDGTIYGVTFDLSSNVYYIDKYPYEIKNGKVFAYVDESVFVAQGTDDENILSVYEEASPDDLMEFWHYEKACVSEGEYFYAEPWAAWTGNLEDYDAQVLDRDKEYYKPILTGVNGVVVETNGTYRDCVNMKEISIPYGITFIGDDCFENCISLRKVTLPKSVAYIDSTSFTGCVSLTQLEFNGTIAEWETVNKYNNWNKDVPATEVVCSDGVVPLK